jgi:phosphoribosylglycinamide formyltransferase-1
VLFPICDRDCGAIQRAINNNINYVLIDKKNMSKNEYELQFDSELCSGTDLIVLAGFIPILSENICKKWENKIINTHPSLLPKYGGKGMYGMNVHRAVVENHEKETGATLHFVNEEYDKGRIISQTKVRVLNSDTAEDVSKKVQAAEKIQLINVLKDFSNGLIDV